MSATEVLNLVDQRDLRASAVGRAVVMVWHEAPTKPTIEIFRQKVAPLHERYADGIVLIVSPGSGRPDDEATKAFKDMMKASEKGIHGAAVLVPVKGMKGTILRGAVGAVVKAIGLPFPVKVLDSAASTAEHAERVLRDKGLDSPTTRELESAIVALHEKHA